MTAIRRITAATGTGLEGGSITATSAGSTVLNSFNTTLYSAVKYYIQATCGAELHFTELSLVHNGTDVFLTEYGTISTTSLVSFDAEIANGSVNLSATTITDNTIIDYKRITMASKLVDSSEWTFNEDLTQGSGTNDLESGTGTIDLMLDDATSSEDLLLASGTDDLNSGTGTEDLMSESVSTMIDLLMQTGSEDFNTSSGTEDLLNT